MKLKMLIILFGSLYFRQSFAADVTAATEAGLCTVCVNHVTPSTQNQLPDMESGDDALLEQTKTEIIKYLKGKPSGSVNKLEFIKVATGPPVRILEKIIVNNLNLSIVDFEETYLMWPADPESYQENSQTQAQISDAEFRRFIDGRAVGLNYKSINSTEQLSGLSYDLTLGQQIFHFHGGAFLKGTLRQKLSPDAEITSDLSIQSNGQRTLTLNYNFRFY